MDSNPGCSNTGLSQCWKLRSHCSQASSDHSIVSGLDPASFTFTAQGEMKCCIKSYQYDLLKSLYVMKHNQMLTDVRLDVANESFHAHKIVLAAASPYFKAMFTSGLREKEDSLVKLQGVCPTVMSKLLSFIYTGEIVINQLVVCQLLPAGSMLQVSPVIQACCTFLESQLDPSNALGIAAFAEQHHCSNLYEAANDFIDQHFIQVCQVEEFLQLSSCQLVALIRRDHLNVREERDVYNAVLKWVRSNEEHRRPRMEDILGAVRCHYLSPSFLKDQMKNCDILKKVPACREHLAKNFQELSLHKSPCVPQRTPSAPCVLYIVAGFSRRSINLFEAFSASESRWLPLTPLPKSRSGLGGAFLRGVFYTVGGRENVPEAVGDSGHVNAYDPTTNTWQSRADLLQTRHRPGLAVLDGYLYALGGASGKTNLDSVERYNPERIQCEWVAPMKNPRVGVAAAVVNRLLYAIGGFNGVDRLKTVECFHPEKNDWIFVSPMNQQRSGAGVVALGPYIFVAGGMSPTGQLNSFERYDTEKDVWTPLSPMLSARSALTLAVLEKQIYAMGGFNGTSVVDVVEIYNIETDQWRVGPPLTCPRSGHASAVFCSPCSAHSAPG
ncbi:kelch-like ECH-associated protein 1 [Daphnia carinata]|uniref:kelch-like ECH-associated protein 1 n=1 Tax=Daphnia carinata TaxID=120202 RepID=UPI00257E9141|nr:kelch-like ECH-associated protein 1 [Daphnia carinata]